MRARTGCAIVFVTTGVVIVGYGLAGADSNIGNDIIEIDGNANLYFDGTGALNPNATIDWVKDNLDNTGSGCLADSIATCNETNVTAAPGGTGHWNGLRIVDGIAGNDQDIFAKGGKENDTTTWHVQPGTVGSSKYDATQAYIANNTDQLFFGMERRGNNGTTAFDFEFNAKPPQSTYIPTRSVGDVLFTFEMQGSGGSGSATPHVFIWNGSSYVEQNISSLAGIYTSINDTSVTAGPWGYVNSTGSWVLGSIPKFEFAEAVIPIGPGGIDLSLDSTDCSQTAYVQVRTRSSSTDTSDLKDTTTVFPYVFSGPSVSASKTGHSATNLTATITASPSNGTFDSYTYQVFDGTNWVDISTTTSTTLTFPSSSSSTFNFENYGTSSATGSFTLGTDTYDGFVLAADLRVVGNKTISGTTCHIASNTVTVKKLQAVDP